MFFLMCLLGSPSIENDLRSNCVTKSITQKYILWICAESDDIFWPMNAISDNIKDYVIMKRNIFTVRNEVAKVMF